MFYLAASFSTLFGTPYQLMLVVGAVFVLLYTILGGFLAESASDFMQAIVMIIALSIIVILGTIKAGGFGEVVDNAREIPGFLEFFGLATPVVDANGQQMISEAGKPLFGEDSEYGILSICSMMAWGLGYFGMPQVLLRFMAIRKESELKRSHRIAMVWVLISLAVAVFIGIVGRQLFPDMHLTKSAAENIFITMTESFLPPIIAGMVSGAAMVFFWKLVLNRLGGAFAIYELLPAFIFSSICIVVVSLLTKAPSKEIEEDFEAVRTGECQ